MFGLPLDPILLVPFMLAGILVNVTPGADVGFVLASGLRGGKRRGMAAALGISLGSLLHTALAAMGVAALLHSHVWAYDALRYLGAVYLAVLAWRAWAGAGPRGQGDAPCGRPRFYDQYPKPKSGAVCSGVPAAVYQSGGGSGLATNVVAWRAFYLDGSDCHNRLRGAGGNSIDASSAS